MDSIGFLLELYWTPIGFLLDFYWNCIGFYWILLDFYWIPMDSYGLLSACSVITMKRNGKMFGSPNTIKPNGKVSTLLQCLLFPLLLMVLYTCSVITMKYN